jgi:excisionase family DNA binding protein
MSPDTKSQPGSESHVCSHDEIERMPMNRRQRRAEKFAQPRNAKTPPDMDVPGAATYMGCSESHVRNLIAAGLLPSCRVGRLIRLRRSDIDAAIEQA